MPSDYSQPSPSPGSRGATAPPSSLYFVNAWVDFSVIGGISIVAYLVAMRFAYEGTLKPENRPGSLITLAAMLAWICNWPHFSATNYRLYHSADNIRQYPLTALLIPPLLLILALGSILSPSGVAPYLAKVYYLWSPYHFSGQTFGITLIYARRCGFKVGRWERLGLSTFVYGAFMVLTSSAEVIYPGTGDPEFYGITYQRFGVPEWLPTFFGWLMAAGGVLFLFLALKWCIEKRRLLPPIVLVPALAQYIWFVPGNRWMVFTEFVPFFHCLQYLLIAWSMQLKEKLDLQSAHADEPVGGLSLNSDLLAQAGAAALLLGLAVIINNGPLRVQIALGMVLILALGAAWLRGWFLAVGSVLFFILPNLLKQPSETGDVQNWEYFLTMSVPVALLFAWVMTKREDGDSELIRPSGIYVVWESLRWGLVNYAGGVMLFFILPSLVARIFSLDRNFAMGVTIATVQLHHFFVDGVIWKLKRKTVSSPLMVNLGDMLGEPSPAVQPA